MYGAASAAGQGLPGGASSLNETHGDWTVTCAMLQGTVRCAASQTQVNNENRQRVLAIELTAVGGADTASGTLVLPFGLTLDRGVVLSIDEAEALLPLRVSTCLSTGCLVQLTFDPDVIAAMRIGSALKVKAVADGSGQEVVLSIPLKGFTSALARVAELTQP
ncbi:MAG: invasion associated locus B family protein [Rhizobiaceae bacterium]|nr:invasion associated locus B family protein [Rhizobiaceae bacterium]